MLGSVTTARDTTVEFIASSPEAAPHVTWSQEADGLHVRLGSREAFLDDVALRKPVTLLITHAAPGAPAGAPAESAK